MHERFTNLQIKSKLKAFNLRILGNKFFIQKDYEKCYYYYTKSLCYADIEDESYGLALANRSALFYDIKDYKASHSRF